MHVSCILKSSTRPQRYALANSIFRVQMAQEVSKMVLAIRCRSTSSSERIFWLYFCKEFCFDMLKLSLKIFFSWEIYPSTSFRGKILSHQRRRNEPMLAYFWDVARVYHFCLGFILLIWLGSRPCVHLNWSLQVLRGMLMISSNGKANFQSLWFQVHSNFWICQCVSPDFY